MDGFMTYERVKTPRGDSFRTVGDQLSDEIYVLDTETTGLEGAPKDLVVDIGICRASFNDCTVEDFGMQAFVRSFGIPGFPNEHYTTKSPNSYSLNLEVRLKNGIIKSFDFDVTDQVAAQPQGGVIIVDGIEISDEEGESGGSGFDVDVDDWGEYEDIELPL